ncbi:alkaline phosphatase family protein, partial [Leucobacter japonicus]|uniref:alkaline phosphatase family protein n=1 Tax=Leucobacter japonicus TaxID=1461259 RepID=UPI000ABF12E5
DNGARLAAILPSGLATVARGLDADLPEELAFAASSGIAERLPAARSFVMVVVDGLGHANLTAVKGHAPTLARLQRRRIETVAPSTTGAALTTLTTGALPGEHGLIGYRIRHPRLGLVTTLK